MQQHVWAHSDGLNSVLGSAHQALDKGHVQKAYRLAQKVLQAAEGRDLHLEANALAFLAHCDRVGNPRLRRASETSRRAVQLFEQLGDAKGEAHALTILAHVTMLLGRNDEAVEAALMAVRLCEEQPTPLTLLAHNVLGLAYSWIGDNTRADLSLEAAVRIANRCMPRVSAYQPRLNQMWVEASRLHNQRFETGQIGDLARLEELAHHCRALEADGKSRVAMPGLQVMAMTISHASMAVLAAWKGNPPAARAEIDAANRSLPKFSTWLNSFVHWCIGELAWAQGALVEAERAFAAMTETALAVEHEQMACRGQLLRAQVLHQAGRADAALEEHRALRQRERRAVEEALRSRESLVAWRLDARQRERQLKRVQDESQEANLANRAKTHFLAAASHDLRQPIHSLNVLVAALAMRPLDERSREIVSLLDIVNQTLSNQLDGLLDISKLDAGAIQPEISSQRLDVIVSSHCAILEPVARERGLTLQLTIADAVVARTDPALFLRLLGNLTDNAIKFTPRGGAVTLSVQRDAGTAVVRVADTGIGIPAAEHDRVFDEFYQISTRERDRTTGLGLGLSIVKRLSMLLGIRMSLTSHLGQGTVMTLSLDEVESAIPADASREASRPVQGLSVLVIDDEPLVRNSMRLLLAELGCVVHLAEGISDAVTTAKAEKLDVVLSDYRLRPPDTGLSAIDAVLSVQPAATVVLVTGDTSTDPILDAQAAGIPLLAKPVTVRDLLRVLNA